MNAELIKKWRTIVKNACHAAFYRNLLVAVAHWVHQPWNYLKAQEFFKKPKALLFPAPTVKKEDIKEIIRKQKTCTHTLLGKSTIDGRGTNAKTTIKTCRQCLMRWKWHPKNSKDPKGPGDWKVVPNPSLSQETGVRALPEPPESQNTNPPASSSGSSWQSRRQPQHSSDQMEEDFPPTSVAHDMTENDTDHDSWQMTESEAPSAEVEEDF